jgi:divalent metal cation (Fe/Co/Zn/Cd) transporter
MLALAWSKRRVASKLGSVALRADLDQTQLCFYLSCVVFIGLAGNSLAGWWWLDPLTGLIGAGLAVKEGRQTWTSGDLCAC